MNNSRDCKTAKVISYIGLSIKAGKAIFGADNIYKAAPKVVITDPTISPNTLKKLNARCNILGIRLIYLQNMGSLLSKPSCKAIGIKDANLANAIIKATETVFEGE